MSTASGSANAGSGLSAMPTTPKENGGSCLTWCVSPSYALFGARSSGPLEVAIMSSTSYCGKASGLLK